MSEAKGSYFVTICTHNRENLFGKIENKKMILNNMGKIINLWWNKIPDRFDNVKLDINQVMPNHFHAIIRIVGAGSPCPHLSKTRLQPSGSPRPPILGQIIAYFKYESTKQINNVRVGFSRNHVRVGFSDPLTPTGANPPTGAKTAPLQYDIRKIWQRNFYEHIIRNEQEYFKIKNYVANNPKIWDRDRYGI